MPTKATAIDSSNHPYETIKLVILFLLVWNAIDLVGRVYKNFTKNQLHLNPHSTWDSLLAASLWIVALLLILYYSHTLKTYGEFIVSGTRVS